MPPIPTQTRIPAPAGACAIALHAARDNHSMCQRQVMRDHIHVRIICLGHSMTRFAIDGGDQERIRNVNRAMSCTAQNMCQVPEIHMTGTLQTHENNNDLFYFRLKLFFFCRISRSGGWAPPSPPDNPKLALGFGLGHFF
jgi:hypothetical protein